MRGWVKGQWDRFKPMPTLAYMCSRVSGCNHWTTQAMLNRLLWREMFCNGNKSSYWTNSGMSRSVLLASVWFVWFLVNIPQLVTLLPGLGQTNSLNQRGDIISLAKIHHRIVLKIKGMTCINESAENQMSNHQLKFEFIHLQIQNVLAPLIKMSK